jgi:hypothetical protein
LRTSATEKAKDLGTLDTTFIYNTTVAKAETEYNAKLKALKEAHAQDLKTMEDIYKIRLADEKEKEEQKLAEFRLT